MANDTSRHLVSNQVSHDRLELPVANGDSVSKTSNGAVRPHTVSPEKIQIRTNSFSDNHIHLSKSAKLTHRHSALENGTTVQIRHQKPLQTRPSVIINKTWTPKLNMSFLHQSETPKSGGKTTPGLNISSHELRSPLHSARRLRPKSGSGLLSGAESGWKKVHTVHQAVFRMGEGDSTREHPRARLQRVLRALRIIIGFCLALKRYAGASTNLEWTLQELERGFKDDSFNIESLSLEQLQEGAHVSKPMKHLGQRLRLILYIRPDKRSTEDVRKIYVFLRQLPTFRHWPISVLLNFCRYAVYQKYQPKQVVLKRGHYPEGYYIILSGTVLINKWTDSGNGNIQHTVFEQTCGDVFGEAELVDNLPRQITVVCRCECEVLIATREDYLEVVAEPLHQIMDANIEFLRGLELFRHFPCEKLSDYVAEFSTKLYSKDSVIVSSTSESDSLVIVKEGKVKVVGEFHSLPKPTPEADLDRELSRLFPEEHKQRRREMVNPDPQSSLDVEWETGEMRDVMKANLVIGVRDPERLVVTAGRRPPRDNTDRQLDARLTPRRSATSSRGERRNYRIRRQQTETMIDTCAAANDRLIQSAAAAVNSDDSRPSSSVTTRCVSSVGGTRPGTASDFSAQGTPGQSRPSTCSLSRPSTSRSLLRSAAGRLRGRRQTKSQNHQTWSDGHSNYEDTDPDVDPDPGEPTSRFVMLDRLGPGSVFGLETLFLKCPLRVALVSEGAKCISFSKKFFVKESNVETLRAASDVIVQYPTANYIRQRVRDKRAWDKYKQRVVREVLAPRQSCRLTKT